MATPTSANHYTFISFQNSFTEDFQDPVDKEPVNEVDPATLSSPTFPAGFDLTQQFWKSQPALNIPSYASSVSSVEPMDSSPDDTNIPTSEPTDSSVKPQQKRRKIVKENGSEDVANVSSSDENNTNSSLSYLESTRVNKKGRGRKRKVEETAELAQLKREATKQRNRNSAALSRLRKNDKLEKLEESNRAWSQLSRDLDVFQNNNPAFTEAPEFTPLSENLPDKARERIEKTQDCVTLMWEHIQQQNLIIQNLRTGKTD